jgi:hypothetical protein
MALLLVGNWQAPWSGSSPQNVAVRSDEPNKAVAMPCLQHDDFKQSIPQIWFDNGDYSPLIRVLREKSPCCSGIPGDMPQLIPASEVYPLNINYL